MLRECFEHLQAKQYKYNSLNESIGNLLLIEEEHMEYLLTKGMNVTEDIFVYKYPGSSFKCINNMTSVYGRKPICNLIENKLNEKLRNIVNEQQLS